MGGGSVVEFVSEEGEIYSEEVQKERRPGEPKVQGERREKQDDSSVVWTSKTLGRRVEILFFVFVLVQR